MAYQLAPSGGHLALLVHARTLPELFAESIRGCAAAWTDVTRIDPVEQRDLSVEAAELDTLYFDALRTVWEQMSTERWLVRSADPWLTVVDGQWRVDLHLSGEPYDATRHRPGAALTTISAAGLSVERTEDGWASRVAFGA